MNRSPRPLQLCGLGWLLAGAVTTALPLTTARPLTAAHASTVRAGVHIRIEAGPSLIGGRTDLALGLSVRGPGPTRLAVTDLVPAGRSYVPGSSSLARPGGRRRALADPSVVTTTAGTLLVWSSVRVEGAGSTSLDLTVAPAVATGMRPATTSDLSAGSHWTDRAAAYAAPEGAAAPVLTAGGGAPRGAADLVATDRDRLEVVAVAAVQTGRLLAPAPARAAQHLEERLAVTTTLTGPTHHVTVAVYLPGPATWVRDVAPEGGQRPAVSEVRLPVTSAQPDQPELPGATTHPGVATTPALFTVLTWHFAVLPAATTRLITYRLDAGPIARSRTHDVVTATATVAAPTTPEPVDRRTAAGLAPAVLAGVQALAVQSWPAAPRAVAAVTTTAGSSTTSTSTSTSTTTAGPRDPFSSSSTTTTTATTAGSTSTTTTSTGGGGASTTTTTDRPGGLATTGSDVVRTGEVGVGLAGGGVAMLLTGLVRRRRPAPGRASDTTAAGDVDGNDR